MPGAYFIRNLPGYDDERNNKGDYMKITSSVLVPLIAVLSACSSEIGNSQTGGGAQIIASAGPLAGRFCHSYEVQYSENFRAFGIPKVPVGTPLGAKILALRGKVIAEKQFYVEDPNDWSIFKDWGFRVVLGKKEPLWSQGPITAQETLYRTMVSIFDPSGNLLVDNQTVTCYESEVAAP
jgi:hypothetical protein